MEQLISSLPIVLLACFIASQPRALKQQWPYLSFIFVVTGVLEATTMCLDHMIASVCHLALAILLLQLRKTIFNTVIVLAFSILHACLVDGWVQMVSMGTCVCIFIFLINYRFHSSHCPELNATLFQSAYFKWLSPLVNTPTITMDQVYPLMPHDTADSAMKDFESIQMTQSSLCLLYTSPSPRD